MAASKEHLFTYGTLRKGENNPMQNYLEKKADWIGKALFCGKLYYANGHPAAILSAHEEDQIVGDVYEFDNGSPLLRELDRYEGYRPDSPDESLYIRRKRDVTLQKNHEVFAAWIYIYNQPIDKANLIVSGDYVQFRRS